MPVVTKETADLVVRSFADYHIFGLDLETTGLNPYTGAKLFSLIISTADEDYYFNFDGTPDHLGNLAPYNTVLPLRLLPYIITALKGGTVFIHNAKFDQKFLLVEEVLALNSCRVICTYALGRLVNNLLISYSLDALGKLIGYEKDDSVEKYITKHKLYTKVDVGKKSPRKDKHYNLVPFDIISNYGMRDGRVCYELGIYILTRLEEMSEEQIKLGLLPLMPVVEREIELTPVLLDMEHTGIKINRAYTREAYEYQKDQYQEIEQKFYALTGLDFEDGRKTLTAAFKKMGLEHGYTEKGNPSFKDELLPDNTLGNLIRDWRHSYKLATTYYKNFLDIADDNDVIHCNFKQGGTSTGRFSCSEPNLQNVPKHGEDSNKYPVRSCFIPREDYFFLMVDYDQMEYRLLLDLAGEEEIINKIKGGLDVHTATAEEMDVDRFAAKTLNFMLLYGGGAQKLANALGTNLQDAKAKKNKYFRTLTKVKSIVNALINTVDRRGFVTNRFGRRLQKPVEGSYKIPNHFIQGGCGDIVKIAMVEVAKLLRPYKSRMLLQIHDELLIELHKDEKHLVPKIVKAMQGAYKEISLPLTAGTDYSNTNWYDKEPYNEK